MSNIQGDAVIAAFIIINEVTKSIKIPWVYENKSTKGTKYTFNNVSGE